MSVPYPPHRIVIRPTLKKKKEEETKWDIAGSDLRRFDLEFRLSFNSFIILDKLAQQQLNLLTKDRPGQRTSQGMK